MYGLRHWLIDTFRLEDENDYQNARFSKRMNDQSTTHYPHTAGK